MAIRASEILAASDVLINAMILAKKHAERIVLLKQTLHQLDTLGIGVFRLLLEALLH